MTISTLLQKFTNKFIKFIHYDYLQNQIFLFTFMEFSYLSKWQLIHTIEIIYDKTANSIHLNSSNMRFNSSKLLWLFYFFHLLSLNVITVSTLKRRTKNEPSRLAVPSCHGRRRDRLNTIGN